MCFTSNGECCFGAVPLAKEVGVVVTGVGGVMGVAEVVDVGVMSGVREVAEVGVSVDAIGVGVAMEVGVAVIPVVGGATRPEVGGTVVGGALVPVMGTVEVGVAKEVGEADDTLSLASSTEILSSDTFVTTGDASPATPTCEGDNVSPSVNFGTVN